MSTSPDAVTLAVLVRQDLAMSSAKRCTCCARAMVGCTSKPGSRPAPCLNDGEVSTGASWCLALMGLTTSTSIAKRRWSITSSITPLLTQAAPKWPPAP